MKTIKIYNFDELSKEAKSKAIERLRDLNTDYDYDWWQDIYEDANTVGILITGFDDHNIHMEIEDLHETAKLITINHGDQCETYKEAIKFLHPIGMDEQVDIEHHKQLFFNALKAEYLKMLQNEYNYRTSDEAIIETIKSNDYHFSSAGKLMDEEDELTVEGAKTFLENKGYFMDKLWSVNDVQAQFECTEEQAQKVLYSVFNGEWLTGEIRESIRTICEDYGLTPIKEEE